MSDAGLPRAPLRVLVLEDEWAARNYLIELIEKSGVAEVVGAVEDLGQAREALDAGSAGFPIDVVFVDVQLARDGDEAGMDLVRAYAAAAGAPTFVLATASQKHAIAAFDLGVVDYLLKPFVQERVSQCLSRVRERRVPRSAPPVAPARIVARRRRSLVFLRAEEVWAFEAADRLASVHTPQGPLEIDLSLAAIEASMGRGFLRVHRNWLVNVDQVREMVRDDGESALLLGAPFGTGGQSLRVPVARERAQAVRELLLTNATGVRRA